jgi:hypothetical protein
MRVHGKSTIYFSDLTSFSGKNFDAQGVRPFEHIRPHIFSPFFFRMEAKSIDEISKSIDQTRSFIDQISSFIDQFWSFIDQIQKFIDETQDFIDQIRKFIDEIPNFIDEIIPAFIAKWRGRDILYSLQVDGGQTISINL